MMDVEGATLVGIRCEGSEDWTTDFLPSTERKEDIFHVLRQQSSTSSNKDDTAAHLDDASEGSWDDIVLPTSFATFKKEDRSLREFRRGLSNGSIRDTNSISDSKGIVSELARTSPRESENSIAIPVDTSHHIALSVPPTPKVSPSKPPLPPCDTDADEDWDEEFGVAGEVKESQEHMLSGFRHVMNEAMGIQSSDVLDDLIAPTAKPPAPLEHRTTIPLKCKVISNMRQATDEIIRYPKPVELFSLKLEGRKQLRASELDEWLTSIVSKHTNRIESLCRTRDLPYFYKTLSKERSLNPKVTKTALEVLSVLWSSKNMEGCRECLKKFNEVLRNVVRIDRSTQKYLRDLDDSDRKKVYIHLEDILQIAAMFDAEEAMHCIRTNSRKHLLHFRLLLAERSLSPSKHQSGGELKSFNEMLRYVAVMFNDRVDMLAVLELRAACHHVTLMLESLTEHSWSPSPMNLVNNYFYLYRRCASTYTSKSGHQLSHSAQRKLDSHLGSIVTDLFFFTAGYNPMTLYYHVHLQAAVERIDTVELDSDNSSSDEEEASIGKVSLLPAVIDVEDRLAALLHQHSNSMSNRTNLSNTTAGTKSTQLSLATKGAAKSKINLLIKANTQSVDILKRVIENEESSVTDIMSMLNSSPSLFINLILSFYPDISKRTIIKAKMAFAMGILHDRVGSADNPAESLLFEALLVVDKTYSSELNEVLPPIVTPLGMVILEKFGELLIKNMKYKFGILALESAVLANILLNTTHEKRLYRRLSVITQESNDSKRLLYYRTIMLRIAKEDNKLNEFVYIANLLTRQYMEMGEVPLGERCIRVAALLHCGASLQMVDFEPVLPDHLPFHMLPQKLQIPFIKSDSEIILSGPWVKRTVGRNEPLIIDSQQFSALLKLVEVYAHGDQYSKALNLSMTLLHRRIHVQGRLSILLIMAKCYLKLRQLCACEAALDRMSYEAEEILLSAQGRADTMSSFTTASSNGREASASKPSRYNRRALGPTAGSSAGALGVANIMRSMDYFLLRAKSRLAASDPEWALMWLELAVTQCPEGKWGKMGKLRYLKGRAYMSLCHDCRAGGQILSGMAEKEEYYATKAEEEFRAAWSLFKHTEDFVRQSKTLSRIVELHVTRVFVVVSMKQKRLAKQLGGKAEDLLRSVDSLSNISLQLAGDTSHPLLLLMTLVNCAELSWILGNKELCHSAFREARDLLCSTYLQPALCEHNNILHRNCDRTCCFPLGNAPLPTVLYCPGMLLRIYGLLNRLIRLSFIIKPSPLLVSGALITSWTRMNYVVNQLDVTLFRRDQVFERTPDSYFSLFRPQYFTNTPPQEQHRVRQLFYAIFSTGASLSSREDTERLPLIATQSCPVLLKRTIQCGVVRKRRPFRDKYSYRRNFNNIAPLASPLFGYSTLRSTYSQDDVMRIFDSDPVSVAVATSSLSAMAPFELCKRAMIIDNSADERCRSGYVTAEQILRTLRNQGRSAVHASQSEAAKILLLRSRCPGLTMTASGIFVHGVMDYPDAEKALSTMSDVVLPTGEVYQHRDLLDILRQNNNIYADAEETFSAKFRSQLGVASVKHRYQVLIHRLKAYTKQYACGITPLQEYQRLNLDIIRLLSTRRSYSTASQSPVHTRDVVSVSASADTPKKFRQFDTHTSTNNFSMPKVASVLSSSSIGSGGPESQFRGTMVSDYYDETEWEDLRRQFPPSFVFTLLIDCVIFLYSPYSDAVSIAKLPTPLNCKHIPRIKLANGSATMRSLDISFIRESTPTPTTPNASPNRSNSPVSRRPSIGFKGAIRLPRKLKNAQEKTPRNSITFKTDTTTSSRVKTDTATTVSAKADSWKGSLDTPPKLSDICLLDFESLNLPMEVFELSSPYREPPVWSDAAVITIFESLIAVTIEESELVISDAFVNYLLEKVGIQNVMFLLTTLMLEESVLILASPGNEDAMLQICTALLRLLRPLKWQYLYIPIMHSSFYATFRTFLRQHRPFLVGAYHNIVGASSTCNSILPLASVNPINYPSYSNGDDRHLIDVTVLDLDTGVVKPGRRMSFAAACMLNESDPLPETNRGALDHILKVGFPHKEWASVHLKPPLPTRYRFSLLNNLSTRNFDNATEVMSSSSSFYAQKSSPKSRSSTLVTLVLSCMCSLFKGMECFLRVSSTGDISVSGGVSIASNSSGGSVAEKHLSIEEDNFIAFLKDDVRPFMYYLLHTRAFKRLMYDVYKYRRHAAARQNQEHSHAFFSYFMHLCDQKMHNRIEFYTTVTSRRVAGYVITYFGKPLEAHDEQELQYLHLFPYTVEFMRAQYAQLQTRDTLKIKRRWCVLDANRLTYFKSRSKRLIKDFFTMDPLICRLVQPSFATHTNATSTSDADAVAIVYGNTKVMVLRAENMSEHMMWVRALRSRLLPEGTARALKKLSSK